MLQRELSYIIQPRSVAVGAHVFVYYRYTRWAPGGTRRRQEAQGGARRSQEVPRRRQKAHRMGASSHQKAPGGTRRRHRRSQEAPRRRQKAPEGARRRQEAPRDEVGRDRERQERRPGDSPGGPGCPQRARPRNNEIIDNDQEAKNSFLLKTSPPKRRLFANTAPAHRSSKQDSQLRPSFSPVYMALGKK